MSDQVLIALIGASQVVLVALLGIVLRQGFSIRRITTATRTDSAQTREHVVNDHGDRNFRDENDKRHNETRLWFQGLSRDMKDTRRDVGGIRTDIRQLRQDDQAIAERLARLEDKER